MTLRSTAALLAQPLLVLLLLLVLPVPARAAALFNTLAPAQDRVPALFTDGSRTIQADQGTSATLLFRLSLYGPAAPSMPLLVQLHERNGDFEIQEEYASTTPQAYSFLMLSFQFQNESIANNSWWYGTQWDQTLKPWLQEAIMSVVREALDTDLVGRSIPGAGVDASRVYLFGHSMGGTGVAQLALRNPDVFAAAHIHAGFTTFRDTESQFQSSFESFIVGSQTAGVTTTGPDGTVYQARDYTDLAWWLENVAKAGANTPFILLTHGTADTVVPPDAGAEHLLPMLEDQKRGFFYDRVGGGNHASSISVQMNRLWNLRKDRPFLAFTARQGYGAQDDEAGFVNDLYARYWDPDTISDEPGLFEVDILGSGTSDVTLRNLASFTVAPGGMYRWWLDERTGEGTAVTADNQGLVTIPAVPAGVRLIVAPARAAAPPALMGVLPLLLGQGALRD